MRLKDNLKMKDEVADLLAENRLDPRQKLCWNYYLDQTSPTFSNAYRSALKAGFSMWYSKTITTRPWFKDKMRRTHLLTKSEKITDKILDMEALDENGKVKADVLRVQADVAKHIQKNLGKDEGYTEKTEVAGGAGNIVFLPQELINRFGLGKAEEVKEEEKDGVPSM